MKFSTIFIIGAVVAQAPVIINHVDDTLDTANPTFGTCSRITGTPIRSIRVPKGRAAIFYPGPDCNGEQTATGTGRWLIYNSGQKDINSVKVLPEELVINENPSYYHHLKNFKGN
jgi:hypothetical protein